jgi:hypothetical protein
MGGSPLLAICRHALLLAASLAAVAGCHDGKRPEDRNNYRTTKPQKK